MSLGALEQGNAITPRQFDHFQPHQVSKKMALLTRFKALSHCDKPVLCATGLRLDKLDAMHDEEGKRRTYDGTVRRAKAGRFSES